jgi:hypothetical protein
MSTQPQRTPLGEQLMNDPGVSAWFKSVQPFVDKLAGIPDGLQQLLQAHFEKRLEIEVNGNLSKQGQNEQRASSARDAPKHRYSTGRRGESRPSFGLQD